MQGKITFGKYEGTCLIIVIMSVQLFLNLPRIMMESAWTAGWILTLYVTVIAFFLFLIIAGLYRNFEGKDLLDIGEYIAGTPGRIITGILLLLLSFSITPIILREYSENIKTISLNTSPLSFVMMFFIVGMLFGAYLGIEAIVRFSAIAMPVFVLGYLTIIFASIKYFDISRITPILGNGPYEIFINGFSKVSIFSGIIVLFIIFPFIKSYKDLKTSGIASILLSGIFFIIGVLSFSLIYQYPTGTESFLPMYQMARLVSFGRFFERAESFYLIVWAASALIYLSIMLFLITYVFKKTFRLKYYRPLIFPFLILIYVIAFIPENIMTVIELEKVFRNYSWILSFLFPMILLVTANIIHKHKQRKADRG